MHCQLFILSSKARDNFKGNKKRHRFYFELKTLKRLILSIISYGTFFVLT